MSDNSLKKTVGNNLRRLIAENYPSQEEFAFDFGIDVRTVSRYVNNGVKDLDVIEELAAFFDVDFSFFLTNE